MTESGIESIEGGGVTSPQGFIAGGVYAAIKTYGPEPRLDVGLLAAQHPCHVAGVFTKNRVVGAPVTLCRQRVASGRARAVVVNSGCSNVANGEQGMRDAVRMTELGAEKLGIAPEEVLVASTGVIGRQLPMERIAQGVDRIVPSPQGGQDFARSMMTTDTVHKSRAVSVLSGSRRYIVGGAAKGSGMVHPDMATVLCFLTTDAPADPAWLRSTLEEVADVSLNMLDVDMDTSTSDSMVLFANGAAGGDAIDAQHPAAGALKRAIAQVSTELTRDLARDGEGARTLIEVRVEGAATTDDARKAARTVVSSPLVKTMVTGRDANMGRVLMALGRSGCALTLERISVYVGEHCAFERGTATQVPFGALSEAMERDEVKLRVLLGLGQGEATAWGCDLTEGYIRINADYTT